MSTAAVQSRSTDFKALYRKLERVLGQFQKIDDGTILLEDVMLTSYTTFVRILASKWGASIDATARISTSVVPMVARGQYRWVLRSPGTILPI